MKRIKHFGLAAIALFAGLLLTVSIIVGQQTAEPDALMRALQDEMARSDAGLKLPDVAKPYFLEYAVTDDDSFNATAAFGSLVRSTRGRSRTLAVHVRVGNYDFDNSEFLSQAALFSSAGFPTSLVVEDDYQALRHDIWLATDAAYKQAAEQLERKRAFVSNRVEAEKLPDFSREEPVTMIAPRQRLQLDQARWEKQLREWSAIFRQFPEIQDSSVTLHVQQMNKYLVNSEGTKTRQPSLLVSLEARASTQAPDGMRLRHSVPFYARSLEALPSAENVAHAIRQMAEELTSLRKAPALADAYSGPVLLSGQASAEMFAQSLAPQLSGQRPPLAEQPQLATMMGGSESKSELADRLNRPVLPAFLSVFDDPAQTSANDQAFIGAYQVDDQGVKAQRVTLVERGVLKNLLLARRPIKDMPHSNGHGRAAFFGGAGAQIGNLFIQASEGKSEAELKQELIKMCKTENLPFGIWIRVLDRPGNPGSDALQEIMSMGMGAPRREALSAPVLAYKVYVEDGREELIRGVTVGEFSVRSLRQVAAAGKDTFVHNRMTTGGGSPFGGAGGGIPTSIVAPAILLEEMELKKPSGPQQKPSLLTHPYFTK